MVAVFLFVLLAERLLTIWKVTGSIPPQTSLFSSEDVFSAEETDALPPSALPAEPTAQWYSKRQQKRNAKTTRDLRLLQRQVEEIRQCLRPATTRPGVASAAFAEPMGEVPILFSGSQDHVPEQNVQFPGQRSTMAQVAFQPQEKGNYSLGAPEPAQFSGTNTGHGEEIHSLEPQPGGIFTGVGNDRAPILGFGPAASGSSDSPLAATHLLVFGPTTSE